MKLCVWNYVTFINFIPSTNYFYLWKLKLIRWKRTVLNFQRIHFQKNLFHVLIFTLVHISAQTLNRKWHLSRCQFHQHSKSNFCYCRSQKRKKILMTWLNSHTFGSYGRKRFVSICWWNWAQIYGVPLSSPTRIVMMTCEVLGISYELIHTNPITGDTKTEKYLKVRPCVLLTFCGYNR